MIPAIRAELRKLLTVRSTYVIILFCLAITIFFSFYLEGFHQTKNVVDPGKLASEVSNAAQALGLFISLAGVLLFTHEYRYNTILYSLTSAAQRGYVLVAKILVVSLFAILLSLIVCGTAPFLAQLGLHLRGLSLAPQDFPIKDLLLHAALYGWGFSMMALLIAAIIRNQVGTIAVLFLVPGLGESLLTLLLKDNAKYLPFTTLNNVLQLHPQNYSNAFVVLLAYLAGGWLVAWVLFMRRDAN